VTLSERDRKLVMIIVPLVVLAGYWFMVLGPKRDAATQAADQLAQQEARLATAKQTADSAKSAENAFQSDFTEVVRLGKAIPASVDMPSLLVQLERAAAGTGIRFIKIATGEREATAAPAAAPATPSTDSSSAGGTPVAAGGETAQSAPGTAVESANDAQATADQNTANAEQSGVSPTDTQTSTTPGSTDTTGATTNAAGATTAGLETVPLDMEFVGDFFNLADFFHSIKRFVRVANQNVLVGGRLITIEGVQWTSDTTLFPKLKAAIKATVYLAPKSEGTTAGATPQGPSDTTTVGTSAASSGASPVPTATATP
jgi:Tfp pilus assembly protein PilO